VKRDKYHRIALAGALLANKHTVAIERRQQRRIE
jgi:hypothetical protein